NDPPPPTQQHPKVHPTHKTPTPPYLKLPPPTQTTQTSHTARTTHANTHTHTHLHRDAPSLPLVGDVHVPGPDVELPLPEAQHPTQHRPRVDPDAHVNIMLCTRTHVPVTANHN